MNLDLKTVVPLGKSPESYLLRYEKSISDDPAFLISKVQPCPTSSDVHLFETVSNFTMPNHPLPFLSEHQPSFS